jgi:hypothetical protein
MTSRRKRGPVAFRHHLSAGLAFGIIRVTLWYVLLLSIVRQYTYGRRVMILGENWVFSSDRNVSFGSQAASQQSTTRVAGNGQKRPLECGSIGPPV